MGAMDRDLGGGEDKDIKSWAKGRGIEMSGRHAGFKDKIGELTAGSRGLELEVVDSLGGGDRVLEWGS